MIRILTLVCLFTLSSCGDSPLLNHDMESGMGVIDTSFAESNVLKFKKRSYSFTMTWELGPQKGESKFIMRTWKDNLGTMNGPFQDITENLHIFLWMPSMGHGSSPVKITKIHDGEYEVSNVYFIMGGKWEIKFQLKDGSQVVDEVVVPLTL